MEKCVIFKKQRAQDRSLGGNLSESSRGRRVFLDRDEILSVIEVGSKLGGSCA